MQSDSVPLINVYFTLCMSLSASSMVWFSIQNVFKENKRVPKFCRYFVLNYLCYIMCVNNMQKQEEKKATNHFESVNNGRSDKSKNLNNLQQENENLISNISLIELFF